MNPFEPGTDEYAEWERQEEADADALWPVLLPLDDEPTRELPAFPVNVLPVWMGELVQAVADSMHTPVDLPAMVALGVCSAALCGRLDVKPRPGWIETGVLYLAVGLDPACRKSPVFRELTKPLHAAERELIDSTARQRGEAESDLRIARKALEHAEAAAARTTSEGSGNKETVDVSALAGRVAAATANVTPRPRLLADDMTPEAMVRLLGEHGHVGLLSAEGGSILTVTGKRYGEVANLDLLLKAHNGESYRADRRGADPIVIERAALTIAVTVQPRVLADLASDRGLVERGLLARFLVVVPPDNLGYRPFDSQPIPAYVRDEWDRRITDTARASYAGGSVEIGLSPDALSMLRWVHERIERQLRVGGELRDTSGWGGKAVGAVVRIAGILAVLDRPDGVEIGKVVVEATYVESASIIVDYLAEHYLALVDGLAHDLRAADARRLWQWIARSGQSRVTVRDMRRGVKRLSHGEGNPRLREAIGTLVECGYIRPWVDPEPPLQTGRPSEQYDVRKKVPVPKVPKAPKLG